MSGALLKKIAVITMFVDHIGAAFFILFTSIYREGVPSFWGADTIYWLMRGIGRSAFPVFCFLLVEGFCHTKSRKKYMLRLFLFALISEIPFDLAFWNRLCTWEHQNVFFTLLLGFAGLQALEMLINTKQAVALEKYPRLLRMLLGCAGLFGSLGVAYVVKCDYGIYGVGLILLLYVLRNHRELACLGGYLWLMQIEVWSFPGFLLLFFYNGQKGKGSKYFYYFFYPVHALVLALLRFAFLKFIGV